MPDRVIIQYFSLSFVIARGDAHTGLLDSEGGDSYSRSVGISGKARSDLGKCPG